MGMHTRVFVCVNAHKCICMCVVAHVHVTWVHLKLRRPKGDHSRPTESTSVARTHKVWCAVIPPLKAEVSGQHGRQARKIQKDR